MVRMSIGLGEVQSRMPTQPTQARRRAGAADNEQPRGRRHRRNEPEAAEQPNAGDAQHADIHNSASPGADSPHPNSAHLYNSQEVGESSTAPHLVGDRSFVLKSPYHPEPYQSPNSTTDAFGVHELTTHFYDQSVPDTQAMEQQDEPLLLTLNTFQVRGSTGRNDREAAMELHEARVEPSNVQPVIRRVVPFRDRHPPNCGHNSCYRNHR